MEGTQKAQTQPLIDPAPHAAIPPQITNNKVKKEIQKWRRKLVETDRKWEKAATQIEVLKEQLRRAGIQPLELKLGAGKQAQSIIDIAHHAQKSQSPNARESQTPEETTKKSRPSTSGESEAIDEHAEIIVVEDESSDEDVKPQSAVPEAQNPATLSSPELISDDTFQHIPVFSDYETVQSPDNATSAKSPSGNGQPNKSVTDTSAPNTNNTTNQHSYTVHENKPLPMPFDGLLSQFQPIPTTMDEEQQRNPGTQSIPVHERSSPPMSRRQRTRANQQQGVPHQNVPMKRKDRNSSEPYMEQERRHAWHQNRQEMESGGDNRAQQEPHHWHQAGQPPISAGFYANRSNSFPDAFNPNVRPSGWQSNNSAYPNVDPRAHNNRKPPQWSVQGSYNGFHPNNSQHPEVATFSAEQPMHQTPMHEPAPARPGRTSVSERPVLIPIIEEDPPSQNKLLHSLLGSIESIGGPGNSLLPELKIDAVRPPPERRAIATKEQTSLAPKREEERPASRRPMKESKRNRQQTHSPGSKPPSGNTSRGSATPAVTTSDARKPALNQTEWDDYTKDKHHHIRDVHTWHDQPKSVKSNKALKAAVLAKVSPPRTNDSQPHSRAESAVTVAEEELEIEFDPFAS